MKEFEGDINLFEKQVLKAVSDIPVDYNPKGWEKLSKQLDAEIPVSDGAGGGGVGGNASLKAWLIGLGISVTLIITGFVAINWKGTHKGGNSEGRLKNEIVEMETMVIGMKNSSFESVDVPVCMGKYSQHVMRSGNFLRSSVAYLNIRQVVRGVNRQEVNGKEEEVESYDKIFPMLDSISVKPPKAERDSLFIFW
ncbi:MAG: hypothetical protein MK066_05675 [Crocinitomicaceae bacterium]|nr:hypothetical protein [Crocinitomicaceae bacterium]